MRSPVCKGWLLGEFYYAGKNLDVRTDDYKWDAEGRLTADLSSGDSPAMIAEIKMALARNASVIEGVLDADAQRLRGVHTAGTQRFLILIIPADQADTEIGKRLRAASYSPKCIHRQWPGFSVRIWQF